MAELDSYEKKVQLALAESPPEVGGSADLRNFQTKFKNILKKQLAIIISSLQ